MLELKSFSYIGAAFTTPRAPPHCCATPCLEFPNKQDYCCTDAFKADVASQDRFCGDEGVEPPCLIPTGAWYRRFVSTEKSCGQTKSTPVLGGQYAPNLVGFTQATVNKQRAVSTSAGSKIGRFLALPSHQYTGLFSVARNGSNVI